MIEFQTTMQQQNDGEASSHHHEASPSPSFSSYSSETLAEIAARVIEELLLDPHSVADDETFFQPWQNDNFTEQQTEDATEDNDFEFAFVTRDPDTSPVSADDIFYSGQIRPMYPIFDRNLLNDAVSSVSEVSNTNHEATRPRRRPLRKLMFEEGETASCSSSTDDSVDLVGLPEGTYCAWTPNSVGTERKKSSSTGSGSKRWKLRVWDLLLRSHSDGKDKQPVMIQIPANKKTAKPRSREVPVEHDVTKNRTVGKLAKDHGDQNKKSFLPYRPEVVGIFSNVNGIGRNLRPF